MQGYDTAQVCLNGHVITDCAVGSPHLRQSFCEDCGERTIMTCPACDSPIRGYYHSPDVGVLATFPAPNFCQGCGDPFPWTSRTLDAVAQLARDDGSLTDDESVQFEAALRDIVRETPQATASAGRLKKLAGKMTSTTLDAVKKIVVSIASEAAKQQLWPGG